MLKWLAEKIRKHLLFICTGSMTFLIAACYGVAGQYNSAKKWFSLGVQTLDDVSNTPISGLKVTLYMQDMDPSVQAQVLTSGVTLETDFDKEKTKGHVRLDYSIDTSDAKYKTGKYYVEATSSTETTSSDNKKEYVVSRHEIEPCDKSAIENNTCEPNNQEIQLRMKSK